MSVEFISLICYCWKRKQPPSVITCWWKICQTLDNHIPFWQPALHVVYPDPENANDCTFKFIARNKQNPIPFYEVCDLECVLVPTKNGDNKGNSFRILDTHKVINFACYRVTEYEQYQTPPVVYSGPDPMTKFYEHMMPESRLISDIVAKQVSMLPLTPQQETDHRNATICQNCNEPFTPQNHKTRHHDHIVGSYLFAACNNCNLQLNQSNAVVRVTSVGLRQKPNRQPTHIEKISFSS